MDDVGKLRQPRDASVLFIFVTVVLDMVALGVMAPVLPKLIIQFQGGDVAEAASITGLFGFAWALMQFLFQPILGAVSDRFGRRPVVLLSNLGLGIDYCIMALAPNLYWLFAGRLLSGITAASFAAASAYIADVTPPAERARGFGVIGAAFGLGFIVGPAIGGAAGTIDLRLPFWIAAGLSLANSCYGYFVLPESLAPQHRAARLSWRSANVFGSARFIAKAGFAVLAAALFLSYLAHESLPAIFVLYTDYRYHWGPAEVSLALAAVGIGSAVVTGALSGRITRQLGNRRTLLVALAAGAAGFAIYGLAPTGILFVCGIPLTALWGLSNPSAQALMTQRTHSTEQGRLQGSLASLRGIAGMIGPLLFTQTLSVAIASGSFSGASYMFASLLLVISIGLTWCWHQNEKGGLEAAP